MLEKIKPKIRTYAIAIAIPLAVGTLAALLTRGNMNIYGEINTPPLSPPAFLFPIVWTALYILMGISSALVYERRENNPIGASAGLRFYAISLFFNFTWSIIFFNFGSFLFAFIWLLLLLYFVVRTILSYFSVSPLAAYLQLPYLAWILFAGYLNFAIWILNK